MRFRPGILLLLLQLLLVFSVAGRFLWERATCPRIWVRGGQYDPETPLRGRYLGTTLEIDTCNLPHDDRYKSFSEVGGKQAVGWAWNLDHLSVQKGSLIGVLKDQKARPASITDQYATQAVSVDCHNASLRPAVNIFIPEHASNPQTVLGKAFWVEVTVPPKGDPRPIRYELRDGTPFTPSRGGYIIGSDGAYLYR